MGDGFAAILDDHLDRSLSELLLTVHHQHTRPCAREQDRGCSAVADAVSGSAPARHDGDLSCEPELLRGIRSQAGLLLIKTTSLRAARQE